MGKRVEGRVALKFHDHIDAAAAARVLGNVFGTYGVEVVSLDLVQVEFEDPPQSEAKLPGDLTQANPWKDQIATDPWAKYGDEIEELQPAVPPF